MANHGKQQLDALGNRQKAYEGLQTSLTLMPNLPVCVRLDGRSFSKFTKGLKRPYDLDFIKLMQGTAKHLLKEFNPTISYVQSDEISLVFSNTYESPMIFNGKIHKLVSVLASAATSYFVANYEKNMGYPLKSFPSFDCRVWNVPSTTEATNCIYWRYLDCKKNSVIMLAQHHFSHKELQGKSVSSMIDKLLVEKDIDYYDDYPNFRQGTFYKKVVVWKTLEDGSKVERHAIEEVELPKPLTVLSHEDREQLVWGSVTRL